MNPKKRTYHAEYQYEYEDGWTVVTLVLHTEGDKSEPQLGTLHVVRIAQPLQILNAFTFTGKTAAHYVMFALAILIPTLIVATLIVCFKTKDLKRKKRWIVFIFLGFGKLSLNWSTGVITVNIFHISLLGAGFSYASPLSPVYFAISFPLGVALFWYFRQTGKLAFKSEDPVDEKKFD